MDRFPEEPFLAPLLERVFRILNRCLSPFEWILPLFRLKEDSPGRKNRVAALTECWVVFNFIAAWAYALLVPSIAVRGSVGYGAWVFVILLSAYPLLRLFEVVAFQAWTQVLGGYRFKQPRASYSVVSLRRSIVIAALLYVEAVAWFGGLYRLLADGFDKDAIRSAVVAIYYSVVTMTTTGYGDITPRWWPTILLVTVQIGVGFFMTVLIISRVVSYLPVPATRDPEEQPLEDVG